MPRSCGSVAPARLRELEHLVDGGVHVHLRERARRFARPVELAHALDGAGDVVDGALHGREARRGPAR